MQVPINFNEKQDNKISIAVDDDLLNTLKGISSFCGKPVATICKEYVAELAGSDWCKLIKLKNKEEKVFVDMAKL